MPIIRLHFNAGYSTSSVISIRSRNSSLKRLPTIIKRKSFRTLPIRDGSGSTPISGYATFIIRPEIMYKPKKMDSTPSNYFSPPAIF